MDKINPDKIRKFYNTYTQMWEINNWYKYSQNVIVSYLNRQNFSGKILNAGSGGNTYGLNHEMVHLDISEKRLKNISNAVVGNLETSTHFNNEKFDSIICVGSVLNYCNSYRVIENFQKWLKEDGELILEFENSNSFEYLFSKEFGCSMNIVNTTYIESEHPIYIYSLKYLTSLLKVNNIEILEVTGFHILSSLLLRLGFSENFATKFTRLDNLLNKIHFFKNHSSNIILKCKKIKK